MKNRKKKLGIAIIAAIMMTGCSNDSGTSTTGSMNTDPARSGSGSSAIDPQSLIAEATTAIANQAASIQEIELPDLFPEEYQDSDNAIQAMAASTLAPTEGNDATGAILLIQEPERENPESSVNSGLDALDTDAGSEDDMITPALRLVARFSGLASGPHGFHIHENGDCSADDASSAGGHFNPTETSHGAPASPDTHVGDLGNISADAYGVAELDVRNPKLFLSGTNSIIGKAVAIHADLDDLSTQPAGNAGEIVACGVIDRYRPEALDISWSN